MELTQNQRLQWLRLIRSENVGAQTFRLLIERFGSAENALEALPDLARKGGKRAIRVARLADVEKEMALAEKTGARFIAISEPDYPALLAQIDSPPPLIAVKGNVEALNRRTVAIVGSRNASAVGVRLATLFAKALGKNGFSITSGFARGIDAAAHKASLATGTIAVMAGGIDHIYPPEHQQLYKEIMDQQGVFVSEMPMGWEPRAKDFPRRNRLIAGIALGLLVVEASLRSGSLISARYAADSGRLVFAIPGSPLDPRAAGTNRLIKDGASLVENADDIVELLTPLAPEIRPDMEADLFNEKYCMNEEELLPLICDGTRAEEDDDLSSSERMRLYSSLSVTPVHLETLSISADIPIPKLYLGLMELDLAGRLIRHNGGLVSLTPA